MRRVAPGVGGATLQSHRTPIWINFNQLEEGLGQSVESADVERQVLMLKDLACKHCNGRHNLDEHRGAL